MRILAGRKMIMVCVVIALIIKVLAMTISAYSYDFLYMIKGMGVTPAGRMMMRTYWTYLLNGLYRLWLSLPVEHGGFENLLRLKQFPTGLGDFLLVFILKLPILLLDVTCGYIIYRIARLEGDGPSAVSAFLIWLFNPLVTLLGVMDGSNDMLIAALALSSVYLFMRGSAGLSGLALAAGAAAKLYTILVAPVLALFSTRRNAVKIISASVLGAAVYFLWVSKAGMHPMLTLLEYTPLTFHASEILLTPYDSRIGLATFSSLLYFYLVYRFWRRNGGLTDAILGPILVYMAFLNWWPPYLLLLMPFVSLELARNREGRVHMGLLLATILLYMLCNAGEFGLSGGKILFYVWNFHGWMDRASWLMSRFSEDVVVALVFKPIVRSVYVVLSILYGIRLMLRNSPRLNALLGRWLKGP